MNVTSHTAMCSVSAARPSETHELREDWSVLFNPGERLVALPTWRGPRLLISANTVADRWRGSAFYPAFRRSARLYRLLLRSKAVLGIGSADVVCPLVAPSIMEFLAEPLPGARVLAVMVGMPGAGRKLVAQLADSRGNVVGYLKCASKAFARQRLAHEYQLLADLPPGVAPVPLKYGSVAGLDLLLLEPICGKPLRPTLPPPAELRHFTASLSTTTARTFREHPWVQQNWHGETSAVESSLAVLSRRTWPVVRQHGDLAPWNMLRTSWGPLAAVDWEDGCSAGFPGMDLAHYLLQVACLIHRWRPRNARDYVVEYLAADRSVYLDLSRAEARAIVTLGAYRAYQNAVLSGHGCGDPTQRWRRAIWEDEA